MKRLRLTVEVPDSADPEQALQLLTIAAYHRRGLTLTTAQRVSIDVDLVRVKEVTHGEVQVP